MFKKILLGFMIFFIVMVFIGANHPTDEDIDTGDTEDTGGSSMLYKMFNDEGGDK